MVAVIYAAYSLVRNVAVSGPAEAFDNALRIMSAQQRLGVGHELAWQQWALRHESVVVAANYFYGTAYIAVTIGTLVWLYRRHPGRYSLWRNTLVGGTVLALAGFALFPLMPPRLMDAHLSNPAWAFVDTMATYPALWSFDTETVAALSNQFAAMPSLHCGWAMWVAAAVWANTGTHPARTIARAGAVGYATTTVVVVVITGNHFFLDAAGGAAVMTAGFGIATVVARTARRRNSLAVQPHTGVQQRWSNAATG